MDHNGYILNSESQVRFLMGPSQFIAFKYTWLAYFLKVKLLDYYYRLVLKLLQIKTFKQQFLIYQILKTKSQFEHFSLYLQYKQFVEKK